MNNRNKISDFRELKVILYHPEKEVVKHKRNTQEHKEKEKWLKTQQLWQWSSALIQVSLWKSVHH
jgi:hypothetical protein